MKAIKETMASDCAVTSVYAELPLSVKTKVMHLIIVVFQYKAKQRNKIKAIKKCSKEAEYHGGTRVSTDINLKKKPLHIYCIFRL